MKIVKFNKFKNRVLFIIDVQKSFSKFFTKNYINGIKEYAKQFDLVYQIWDNHHEGKNVDLDYLYDEKPIKDLEDLYEFPNQKDVIEKRYNYNVSIDFYKKILDPKVYIEAKKKESSLKAGDNFPTTEGTMIVYINNNHKWFHVPKKLFDILNSLKSKEIVLVGGSMNECLRDVEISAIAIGSKVLKNSDYIYSAKYCPIK